MKTATFAQNLLSMQTELLHFAYKLTADREEANTPKMVEMRLYLQQTWIMKKSM